MSTSFSAIAAAAERGRLASSSLRRVERGLEGFRAAPLREDELVRRAGQLDRFLQLVPIEYGRGVSNGRVTLDFEIQEAVTFRDGAETAYEDLLPTLMAADARAARKLGAHLDALGTALADTSRGDAVAAPEHVEATTSAALALVSSLYPTRWKEAAKTADFDVIAATLDRLRGAAAAGDWKGAESARLEAYGIFELEGGGSSLYQGYGGALSIWGDRFEGNVGVGYLDGFRFSVFMKHRSAATRSGWATMPFPCVSRPTCLAARTASSRKAPAFVGPTDARRSTRSSARARPRHPRRS